MKRLSRAALKQQGELINAKPATPIHIEVRKALGSVFVVYLHVFCTQERLDRF